MAALWKQLKAWLVGRRFNAARTRSNDAADRLDAALREILRR